MNYPFWDMPFIGSGLGDRDHRDLPCNDFAVRRGRRTLAAAGGTEGTAVEQSLRMAADG